MLGVSFSCLSHKSLKNHLTSWLRVSTNLFYLQRAEGLSQQEWEKSSQGEMHSTWPALGIGLNSAFPGPLTAGAILPLKPQYCCLFS